MGGTGKGTVDIARINPPFPAQVRAQRRVHKRCVRVKRRLHVADRRQRRVIDVNHRRRILGLGAALRDDHRHGFALPMGHANRQRGLRRRLHARHMGQNPDKGRHMGRDIRAGISRHDPRHRLCNRQIQPDDPGMGMRRADESGMQHPGQGLVAHEPPLALQQTPGVGPGYRPANLRIALRHCPALSAATSAIASTIA